jgi:signal transduction histidine kinase
MYDKVENIIISIKDTGIGIPNDKLDIIFDRFRQVDKSLARNHEGSGIGLSIVKSLVELHGGKISVHSKYGKGTEFIIVFPVIAQPKESGICGVIEAESQERIERMHIEFSDIYSLN